MGRLIDLSGKHFGRLKVIGRAGSAFGEATWLCDCDCGQQTEARGYYLRTGQTQSCGCLHSEIASGTFTYLNRTHGKDNTPEHVSWEQMKQRCNNPKHHAWEYYGGRGITVCASWQDSFETFLHDMGPRPANTSLDRIDPDGNYEPGNCRWADARTQRHNRSKRMAA